MFTARGRIAGYGRPGAKGPAVPVRTLIGCKAYGRIVGHLPYVKAAPAIIKPPGINRRRTNLRYSGMGYGFLAAGRAG